MLQFFYQSNRDIQHVVLELVLVARASGAPALNRPRLLRTLALRHYYGNPIPFLIDSFVH